MLPEENDINTFVFITFQLFQSGEFGTFVKCINTLSIVEHRLHSNGMHFSNAIPAAAVLFSCWAEQHLNKRTSC